MNKQPEQCTEAKIVHEKPLSGIFEEVLFGAALGNTLWVHFSDQFGIVEWIGKFDCGNYGGNKVTKVVEPDKFFICAGGWFYFVNATDRKLFEEPYRTNHVLDAIYDTSSGGVLIADSSKISLVKSGAIIWSVKMPTDGIRNLRLEGNVLRGLGEFGYDGSENEFHLNLETRKMQVGQRFITNAHLRKEKSWWKFW